MGYSKSKFPLGFFLLTFALALPFYILGFFQKQFLPASFPADLPISSLSAFCPFLSALILSCQEKGIEGVKSLWGRILDFGRCKKKAWFFLVFGITPALMALSYLWMRLAGTPMPNWNGPVLMIPVLFLVLFIFAIGEEGGWMGYAIDPLQNRWGALKGGLLLGFFWLLGHVIPFAQTHHPTSWYVWQAVQLILFRVILVWLYNNTGKSLFTAVSCHAMYNLSWLLFPNYGSSYDPFVFDIFLAAATAIALLVEPRSFWFSLRQNRS